MLQTLKNAWKIVDLRHKILFTALIVILYRLGAVIPVPYIDSTAMSNYLAQADGSIFQYLNIMSGDAFSKATLFALSITPYITASIVMQLLTIAIPALEKLQKSGDEGRKKITQITRYVTVGLGLATAYGYYTYMRAYDLLLNKGVFAAIVIIACYSAGTALIMWLAEKINENGIGNGISIILFANIVAGLPNIATTILSFLTNGTISGVVIAILSVVIGLATIVIIVFMTNSERRIPVQYAKKVVGRKMYGGQSTTLPIKLNMSGVMPIIFANSIVALPATIGQFINPAPESWGGKILAALNYSSILYSIIFFILIILFAYFYIAISFNPVEVANNLKKNGGFIPGIRPGKPTADYITKILNKITLIGALFLGVIAVFPLVCNVISGGILQGIAFGGSSIIIVVGVALETSREIEAQMTMRHYKGFLE